MPHHDIIIPRVLRAPISVPYSPGSARHDPSEKCWSARRMPVPRFAILHQSMPVLDRSALPDPSPDRTHRDLPDCPDHLIPTVFPGWKVPQQNCRPTPVSSCLCRADERPGGISQSRITFQCMSQQVILGDHMYACSKGRRTIHQQRIQQVAVGQLFPLDIPLQRRLVDSLRPFQYTIGISEELSGEQQFSCRLRPVLPHRHSRFPSWVNNTSVSWKTSQYHWCLFPICCTRLRKKPASSRSPYSLNQAKRKSRLP